MREATLRRLTLVLPGIPRWIVLAALFAAAPGTARAESSATAETKPVLQADAALSAEPVRAPAGAAIPAAPAAPVHVSYVSQEHVYIDAGKAAGIVIGDTLTVTRDGRLVARMVVAFAAEHSATCMVVPSGAEASTTPATIHDGDVATVSRRVAPDGGYHATSGRDPLAQLSSDPPARRERSLPDQAVVSSRQDRPGARTWGSVGIDHVYASGPSSGAGGYARSTLRVHMIVAGLGEHHSLNVHWRGRRDARGSTTLAGLSSAEWRNNVYELSVRRDPVHVGIGGEVGRFSPRIAAVGGLMDGVLVMKTLSIGEAGVFAGTEPAWGTAVRHPSAKRAGAYTSLRGGPGARVRWFAAVAAVGQYSEGSVDREFVSLRGSLDDAGAWSFAPSAVIDVNRRWRRDAAGTTLTLSRLDITAAFNPRGPVTWRAGYNRDRAPWTVAVREIPDSLYERPPGESWRLNASLRAGGCSFGAGGGNRRGAGSPAATWFWNGEARRIGVLERSIAITLRASGYSGPLSRGMSPSIEARRDPARGPRAALATGFYRYEAEGLAGAESNQWFRFETGANFARGYNLDIQYEHASGEALATHTARVALMRRF